MIRKEPASVLELIPTEATIVACHADPAALDGCGRVRSAVPARVAPDELWLVGDRSARAELLAEARAGLPGGLVVDQTDGWAVWTVRGSGAGEVLARLMLAPVPATEWAFVQGAITGVPGKVIGAGGTYHLFVPSPVGHHVRDRILASCADLGVEVGAPYPFSLEPR